MPLEFIFGHKKTPEEMLRENQRPLTKAMRDLDRERAKMENQEKKVNADIESMPKQMDAAKIKEKDLQRIRSDKNAIILITVMIQSKLLQAQTFASDAMAKSITELILYMLRSNKELKNQHIHEIMLELSKSYNLKTLRKEIKKTNYALGDADAEKVDAIVSQAPVLDEPGLQMADELSGTRMKARSSKVPAAQASRGGVTDADLEERLKNLKLQ